MKTEKRTTLYRKMLKELLNSSSLNIAKHPDLPSALQDKIETRCFRASIDDLNLTAEQTSPDTQSFAYLGLYDALRKLDKLLDLLKKKSCQMFVCRNDLISYDDGRLYHPTVYLHRGFKGLEIRLGMIAAQESWQYPTLLFEALNQEPAY